MKRLLFFCFFSVLGFAQNKASHVFNKDKVLSFKEAENISFNFNQFSEEMIYKDYKDTFDFQNQIIRDNPDTSNGVIEKTTIKVNASGADENVALIVIGASGMLPLWITSTSFWRFYAINHEDLKLKVTSSLKLSEWIQPECLPPDSESHRNITSTQSSLYVKISEIMSKELASQKLLQLLAVQHRTAYANFDDVSDETQNLPKIYKLESISNTTLYVKLSHELYRRVKSNIHGLYYEFPPSSGPPDVVTSGNVKICQSLDDECLH